MWISDLAIRKPIAAIVAMVVLVLGGTLALVTLQTDEFPDVALPVVAVTVPYPGASPAQVERELLRPIEQKLRGLGGLKRLIGQAEDGAAVLFAEFVYAKAPAEAMQDVRDAVAAVRGELPTEAREPVIARYSETDLPVQSLVLASTSEPTLALGERARRLARQLRTIPGVAEATVIGAPLPELAVRVRPEALRAHGVTLEDVAATLQQQNVAVPVGRLTDGDGEQSLRLLGRPSQPADFAALAVRRGGAGLVRLGDVALVEAAPAEARSAAYYNGVAAVSIDVRKTRGASTTAVADRVREALEAVRRDLPAGTSVTIVQDAGIRTGRAVRDVQKTLLEGAALTVLVVFVFLNSWRSTVITGLALPVSVLASFLAVKGFGFKLETMSLLGLSLAIGLLIDDAIVVRENIVRHLAMGKDHVTAAREGTAEIGLAVVATTLAIVVVFLPVAFMDGVAGQYFKPFALTIACAVLVSLFVSFSLDPMLSAYWPDPPRPATGGSWLTRRLERFNAWFDARAEGYRRVVVWALTHRGRTLGVALGALALTVALPAMGAVGSEFLPEDDQSELRVTLDAPPGSSLAYTVRRSEAFIAVVRRLPEVRATYLTVGTDAVTRADLLVQLVPRSARTRSAREVITALRAASVALPGVDYAFIESGGNASGQLPIQLQVQGPDAEALGPVAQAVAAAMRAVPGAVDVTLGARGGQPQLDIAPDRAIAARLGVTAQQLGQSLQAAYAGVELGDWVDAGGETRKVVLRLDAAARRSASDLALVPLPVTDAMGTTRLVPLPQVATVTPGTGPARIDHKDGEPAVTISANVDGRPLGDVAAAIDRAVAAVPLPAGVRIVQAGDVESQREVFGNMLLAIVLALAGMYLVLVLQFNSWLEPLAILASLPLSLVGVVGALALTGGTINLMSLIGVILLAGVVAKNAILLLEFAKQLQEEHGLSRHAALAEAGAVRLRPIVMTTVALVAGMIPVALGQGEGAQFRAPLGVAVIGGTLSATILTLLVIPALYDLLCGLRRSAPASHPAPTAPAPTAALAGAEAA